MASEIAREAISLGIGIQGHIIRSAYDIRTIALETPVEIVLMADVLQMDSKDTIYGSYCRITDGGMIGLYRLTVSYSKGKIDIGLVKPYGMETCFIWSSTLLRRDSLVGILVIGFKEQWLVEAHLKKAEDSTFFFEVI